MELSLLITLATIVFYMLKTTRRPKIFWESNPADWEINPENPNTAYKDIIHVLFAKHSVRQALYAIVKFSTFEILASMNASRTQRIIPVYR